jgi:serine/threonine-protein kinase HipA
LRLAKHLGLSAASAETTLVNGRKLIIVERYDRVIHADGSVQRLHEEDFCQATGVPPDKKYQEGGPLRKRWRGRGAKVSPITQSRTLRA